MAVKSPQPAQEPEPLAEVIPVALDVGGQLFRTVTSTLRVMPITRLGKVALEAERNQAKSVELFFDRNPDIMNSLLGLYRTGKLHLPEHVCAASAVEELHFWEVPLQLLQDCCRKRLESHENDEAVVTEIDTFLADPYSEFTTNEAKSSWRLRIWLMLERPDHSIASKLWNGVFIVFIFLGVLTFALESVFSLRSVSDTFRQLYPQTWNMSLGQLEERLHLMPMEVMAISLPHDWLQCLRYLTLAFFGVDFIIRLVVCPVKKRFFCQLRNWLEVLIIVQSCIFFILESVVMADKLQKDNITKRDREVFMVVTALTSLRALRIFYIARNFDNMKILLLCAKSSVKELLMLLVCVASFVTLFGSLVYTAEMLNNLNTFCSVPVAIWWAIITMTTVGYGDVYPVSVSGQIVGSVCALSGLIVVALPIAVIASKFSIYHDNLCPRQQRRVRAHFLKNNPQFDFTGGGNSSSSTSGSSSSKEGEGVGSEGRCFRRSRKLYTGGGGKGEEKKRKQGGVGGGGVGVGGGGGCRGSSKVDVMSVSSEEDIHQRTSSSHCLQKF